MSDIPPSIDTASLAERDAEIVTPDAIESILSDFRHWLVEAKDAPPVEPAPHLDVATVVQHFIALRQEVNLQTKSTRAQTEQSAQTVVLLQEALGELQRQQHLLEQNEESGQDELLRPLLKTLIDAFDALSLAEREVKRLLELAPTVAEPVPLAAAPPVPPPTIKLKIPHWARWIGLDTSIEAQLAPLYAWVAAQSAVAAPVYLDDSAQRYRQSLDALLVGYRMSLQRIDRAIAQQGLEVIACVGEPFDPETMEVAEVVREEGRTSTEVLQEIRRGYRWRGRLFRYAQVRVAKP
jgi:molecular chaperone GrpE